VDRPSGKNMASGKPKVIALPANFDFKKLGVHMPRIRCQQGWISLENGKWVGHWHLYVRLEDCREVRRNHQRVLGLKSKMTKGDARELLRKIIDKELGPAQHTRPDSSMAFHWFWEHRFLPVRQGKWSRSQIDVVNFVGNNHLLPRFGDTRLADFNKFDIQLFLNELADKYSKSLVDKAYTYLNAALEEAIDQDYLEKNPCRKVEMPRTKKPCEFFLSLNQINTLDTHLQGKDRLIFRLFVLVGFRPGELFAIRWEDVLPGRIVIDEGVYRNKLGGLKTEDSEASIPIPVEMEEEIKMHRLFCDRTDPKDFVFEARYRGRPMENRSYLRRFLKPLAKSTASQASPTNASEERLRRTSRSTVDRRTLKP